MTHIEQIDVAFQDSANLDAFGRLRISNPETLFDSKQIFDSQPLFWDDSEETGSGTTSVHSAAAARTRIGVAATTAGKRTRQTFQRFNYQPGKSQLVMMTALMSAPASGITASLGYFDDDNGMFFSSDDGTLYVVCRSSVTGSPVDTKVSSANWNGDPMDGTGTSGVTLDPTKTQIMWMDLEWLGVGRVRMGFIIDGLPILAHEFQNTNALDVVYMSTPNLPLRYQIENDGTGAATTMDHICSTVISEGGAHQDLGVIRCASTLGAHVDCAAIDTNYAIVGIRLKAANLGAFVEILETSMVETVGSKTIEWLLIFNPIVAGTFTYGDIADSSLQFALGATANTVTGGTVIGGGHFTSGNKGGGDGSSAHGTLRLGAAIDGTRDTIVLVARPIDGTNSDIDASMLWREVP